MTRKQAKSHHLQTSRSPTSNLPLERSQGPSQPSADVSSIPVSANTDRKLLSRAGHLLRRWKQTRSDPPTTDAIMDNQVDAAQQAMDDMTPIPPVFQSTIGLVGRADVAATMIQTADVILQPLKLFNSIVSTVSNVHPYVQFALVILTASSQLLIDQANLDSEVFGLLNTVKDVYEFLMEKDTIENIDSTKETLSKISQEMSATALFVVKYCKKQNFFVRIGNSLVSDPQTVARGHMKNLGGLMQQYRDRTMRDIQINMYHVLEDLSLEGMAYAAGAGLNTTRICLDGTRTEILKDIIHWIANCDVNAPRILWLHGQAGRGKSAIAHTIGSWIQDVGAPGTFFCFARDRQNERREEKIVTTIARDLADREPAFRRVLSNIVSNNHSLKTTCDVLKQWKRFVLEPLSKISGEIIGNVVVIIDALDESGPEMSRRDILRLLTSSDAGYLPTNFRILLTSRPLPDIVRVMRAAPHVKATSLDDIPWELVERDIRLYVSKGLEGLPGIGMEEIQNVVNKSSGLFEWARVACEFIKPNKAGATPKEHYDDLMALEIEEGRTLLDTTYFTILEGGIPQSGRPIKRYRSVMRQVVMTLEPLPMVALNCMREYFPDKQDHYDVNLILEFMAPVLGGIVDRSSPVRPLHASFYDFLMDPSRSGVYSIDASDAKDLAFATVQILCDNLQFNICGLESSYMANAEVSDLSERINKNIPFHLSYSCQFWGWHLEQTRFDLVLVGKVKNVVESEKILFWMEILSLLGRVGKGVSALASVRRWLLGTSGFGHTLTLAEDGIKFMQHFSSMMLFSTPHLYVSALPFIPSNTSLSAVVMPKLHGLARVAIGRLKTWPAVQLLLQGHSSEVNSVLFSPDGKRIVSGSGDNTVRVWDVEGGVQIGSSLEGHTSQVTSVAFSPDGKRIVSGSGDNTARVWDVEGGVQIGSPLEGHTSQVTSVGFSPDGKMIVSGSLDKTVRVWDVKGGVQIGHPLESHNFEVTSVAFSPDGKRVALGSDDKTVRVWDVGRGVQFGSPLEGHTSQVTSVAFSPDGKRIISGSDDKTVRIWDVEGGLQIGSPLEGHTYGVTSVALSPDGRMIVSGSLDNTVRVWDVEGGVQIGGPLENHTSQVTSVGFSPDGKRIVSGSLDNTVRVWDVEGDVQSSSPLEGHNSEVTTVAFSPDGKRVASGSWDRTVRVWDVEGGVQIGSPLEGHTSQVTSVASSPDGKRIVSGSDDKTVRIWDAEGGVQIGSPLEGHTSFVTSVGYSPDGKRIVSGSWDKTVRVWDVDGGVQIGSPYEGHAFDVTSVGFSPDGKRIVSGSGDNTVRVWDVEGGVQIGSPLKGHTSQVTSVAFSPDGKRIVSGSGDNTVRVWDVEGGVQIGSPLEGHTSQVTSVGFSHDGKMIVSGSWDKTVRVWDAEGGVQVGSPLEGHTSDVTSVGFSPDGKRIVSGSLDKTVRVWDVEGSMQIGNPIEGPTSPVHSAAFSPDGTRTASGASDKHVGILNCEGHQDEVSENLKLVASTSHSVFVPSHHVDGAKGYPICFSSHPSHALPNSGHLVHGFRQGDKMWAEPVKLEHDGWIKGPRGRLLLWIPTTLRNPFYSMWNTAVIPRGCCLELDLSQMAHGMEWRKCVKAFV